MLCENVFLFYAELFKVGVSYMLDCITNVITILELLYSYSVLLAEETEVE
jgi:hypothetical protein